jgi:hypothetical protein
MQLAQASPVLLRAMVTTFAEALMGAEADGELEDVKQSGTWLCA